MWRSRAGRVSNSGLRGARARGAAGCARQGWAANIVLSRAREAATDLDGVVAEAELVELAVTELGEEADVEAARQGLELKRLGHDDQEVGHCHDSARSLTELAVYGVQ